MCSGAAPTPPNYRQLAKIQDASNLKTGIANTNLGHTNTNGPMGSVAWSQTGTNPDGTPQYTQNTTLNPGQQLTLNRTNNVNANALQQANSDLNNMPARGKAPNYSKYAGGPQLQTSLDQNGSMEARQRVEDALLGRLNTQSERDRGSLNTRLTNQGIREGSDAWTRAQGDFDKGLSENRTNAILGAGQEQQLQHNMQLSAGNFGNQGNQQMFTNRNTVTAGNNDLSTQRFNNANTLRTNNVNEINALRTGAQVQLPGQAAGGAQMPTTDIAGLATTQYGQQAQAYQQQQANNNSLWGGILGAGANLLTLSDRRAKKNVRQIGKLNDGQPVFSYAYKGDDKPQIGLIAQEVQKTHPEAVHELFGGILAVDYGKATEAA